MNDLNLFIATQIEPVPVWNGGSKFDGGTMSWDSPLMCWRWHGRKVYESYHGGTSQAYDDKGNPEGSWQPRDFRTDPAAILMLMERMLQEGYEITLMRGWPGCSIDLELGLMYLPRVTAPTTGNAIALAFARAHGYKETE